VNRRSTRHACMQRTFIHTYIYTYIHTCGLPFALPRYLSEIRFQVLTAIYPRFTHESGTIRKKQAIDVSKLKRLLCCESQHQSQSNEKSLVRFDHEKAVSNYLGTQSTFKALLWESIILLLPPPTCKAYPIATLLHDHCAIYAPPSTPA